MDCKINHEARRSIWRHTMTYRVVSSVTRPPGALPRRTRVTRHTAPHHGVHVVTSVARARRVVRHVARAHHVRVLRARLARAACVDMAPPGGVGGPLCTVVTEGVVVGGTRPEDAQTNTFSNGRSWGGVHGRHRRTATPGGERKRY